VQIVIAGARIACRLVAFSAKYLRLLRLNVKYVIIMENYTNSEMTDMVLCYSFVSRKVSAHRVPHSQTFLAVVQRLRENGTFRPRSVHKGQERTPQMLDLEPQILGTVGRKPVNKYPAVRALVREFQFLSLW
jgi:hypothetical protein